ncbi:MFS domain-containing protein [Mycena chlorophos]|uniref:MFS domain-containing protein n=1 Tax=Mycena chlorophos TaxID=658473 RepID=A0A8H6RXM2_MYCCL|nr:MFS domain-containing protein [Mycena chlorophos]
MQAERAKHDSEASELASASSTDSNTLRLRATSASAFKLYLVLLVPSLGSICTGYDIAVMNYINGMEQYLEYFQLEGQNTGGGVGSTTGLIFAMVDDAELLLVAASHVQLGTCSMVLFAGPIADIFGRRGALFSGGLLAVIGTVIMTFAQNIAYLKSGRFLIGAATALIQVAAPMYVTEISPPQWRGRTTGIYAAISLLATIVSGVVTNVTSTWPSSASWRVPLGLQIIPAAGVFLFAFAIPESPRWLVSVGQHERARRILSEYHGNRDVDAPLVVLELHELAQSIKTDATKSAWWDYAALVRTRSDRHRSAVLLLLALTGQWAGVSLSYFLVVLLASDRISAQSMRILLSLVSGIVAAFGGVVGGLLSDNLGRRRLWFWGTVCCTVSLIVSGVCTAVSGRNIAVSNTAITFIFLFTFFYCATYVPLPAAYTSECMPFEKRANGVAMYTFAASLASLISTYATPIALDNIGWRLYFVFIGWDLLACVLIYCFAVETSGKTLEELEDIFEGSRAH